MALFPADDPNAEGKFRDLMGPGAVDQMIRQALQFAWMSLPQEKKTVEELERVVRRLLDRALDDLKEDQDLFGRMG